MEIVHCNRLLSNVWIGCEDRELEPWLNYIDKDNGHCSSKTLVRVWRLANSRSNRNKNQLMTHDHLSRSKPVISTDRKTVEFSPSLLSGCAHLLGDEPALELAEWGNGVSKIYHTMNGESQPGITLFETRGFRWQRTPKRTRTENTALIWSEERTTFPKLIWTLLSFYHNHQPVAQEPVSRTLTLYLRYERQYWDWKRPKWLLGLVNNSCWERDSLVFKLNHSGKLY